LACAKQAKADAASKQIRSNGLVNIGFN
jgi:hypothetical protein